MTDLSFISQKRKLNLQKFNILLFTILFLLFHDFPLGNGAFGTVETDANFYESLAAGLIRNHVTFLVNLPQGFFGTFIYFQLEYINRVWHVHYSICATYGTFHLCMDIDVEETEHKVEDGLKMLFRVVFQVVWNGSLISTHMFQSILYVIAINSFAET